MKKFKDLLTVVMVVVASLFTQSSMASDTIISKQQLPQKALSFITNYFKGKEISYVKQDKELFSTSYEVQFVDRMKVEFDGKGEWEEVDGHKMAIPTGFINTNIVNYVKKNFAGVDITKVEKGFRKIEVKLSNGLELEFTKEGKFSRIDD